MEKQKVIISVDGGVAYVVECPDNIEVQIIDHDNVGWGYWYQIGSTINDKYVFEIYKDNELIFDVSDTYSSEEECGKEALEYISRLEK